MPGYHSKTIEKGKLGEASKIREELEEFLDSLEQGCKVMSLVELSDLLGAIKAYLANYHPSISLQDLLVMTKLTERAFRDGTRT